MDIAQGRDLAPLFGDLGQREKRSEIELPLAAAAAAAEFALSRPSAYTSVPNRRLTLIQLNKYETAPNFIQLSQNLTLDCLLISVFFPVFPSFCMT